LFFPTPLFGSLDNALLAAVVDLSGGEEVKKQWLKLVFFHFRRFYANQSSEEESSSCSGERER
jgi:hypothetical protein